jgi:hypothetical protein
MEKIRTSHRGGLFFGLLLVVIGLLFLGFNGGWIPNDYKQIIFSWPMLLTVIGIGLLFKRNHWFGGLFLTAIGIFFIMPRVAAVIPGINPCLSDKFRHDYWPLLLIVIGLLLIGSWFKRPRRTGCKLTDADTPNEYGRQHREYARKYQKQALHETDGFSWNAILGSGEYIVLDPVFPGGDVNAVLGGILLDLRKTTISEGDTFLEVNAVLGGFKILVPDSWTVVAKLDSVAGGFQDRRTKEVPRDPSRRLIISGACVFGGGEVRN